MKIAIVGTGQVGHALALALTAAGHNVVTASRRPTEHPGFPSPVATYEAAVDGADVVINATPGDASLAVFEQLGSVLASGAIVLDAANAATDTGLLVHADKSLAEKLQAALPQVRLVKALNTFNIAVMTDPSVLSGPTSTFIAGNDQAAKSTVRSLLLDLGWADADVVDLGALRSARALEHYFLMFLALYNALGTAEFNVRVVTRGRGTS